MIEHVPPCKMDGYGCKVADPWDGPLCKNIANNIIEAGGAGAFEESPCPFEALWVIVAGENKSEHLAEVCRKLGIVGVLPPNAEGT